MGYRYYYSMTVEHINEKDVDVIVEILKKHSGYECESNYNETHHSVWIQFHDVRWDDPTSALKELSEQFSDNVFAMDFIGDEWDDRGTVYAKNGKTQTCMIIISYEEPDKYFV